MARGVERRTAPAFGSMGPGGFLSVCTIGSKAALGDGTHGCGVRGVGCIHGRLTEAKLENAFSACSP
jgi:hypothetical protein